VVQPPATPVFDPPALAPPSFSLPILASFGPGGLGGPLDAVLRRHTCHALGNLCIPENDSDPPLSPHTTCCGVDCFRRFSSADFLRVEEISISSGIASERDSGHSYTLHYP